MISVVTVKHTGTIYTFELLRRWEIQWERKHIENIAGPPNRRGRFGPAFPGPSDDFWRAYPDGRRVLCTLRDPILAVISSINRGERDQDIHVDGWAVMAEWHERELENVHFLRVPADKSDLVKLAAFVGASNGSTGSERLGRLNAHGDTKGIKAAYEATGVIPDEPSCERAAAQIAEMPAVENLFADHDFDLPWFAHSLEEREEANYWNTITDPRELKR